MFKALVPLYTHNESTIPFIERSHKIDKASKRKILCPLSIKF